MNIVLVTTGEFQEYIIDNIKQLLILKNKNIYVITNQIYFEKFNENDIYKKIKLINADILNDKFEYSKYNNLSNYINHKKPVFWFQTSNRFFVIYSFMVKYNIENVIHFENDVLSYYNCDILMNSLDKSKVYIPIDCYKRNVASIVFIPNHQILETILNKYNYSLSDMENFIKIKQMTNNIIENFPISMPSENYNYEQNFVCSNFENFNMIFDAASIGQYLGGVDPINFLNDVIWFIDETCIIKRYHNYYQHCKKMENGNYEPFNNFDDISLGKFLKKNDPMNIINDTIGFVNETCVIKYNDYFFFWEKINDEPYKPFIIINKKKIPIFNLHIHSKQLKKFIFDTI